MRRWTLPPRILKNIKGLAVVRAAKPFVFLPDLYLWLVAGKEANFAVVL